MGIQEHQLAQQRECRIQGKIEGLRMAKALAMGHTMPFVEPRHFAEMIQRVMDDLDKERLSYAQLAEERPNILPFTKQPQ